MAVALQGLEHNGEGSSGASLEYSEECQRLLELRKLIRERKEQRRMRLEQNIVDTQQDNDLLDAIRQARLVLNSIDVRYSQREQSPSAKFADVVQVRHSQTLGVDLRPTRAHPPLVQLVELTDDCEDG